MFYSFEKLQTIIQYGNNNAENLSNVIIKMGSNGLCEFNKWKICSFYDENISSLDSLCKEEKECELLNGIVNSDSHYHCSCNEPILHPFLVRNIDNNNTLIIGSSCIKNFFPEEALTDLKEVIFKEAGKKRCNYDECDHQNAISFNQIKKCLKINPEQNKFYHKDCMKYIFNKCKICKNYKTYNCSCPPAYETIPVSIIEPIIQQVQPSQPVITTETIISFGKFKGKRISDLLKDISYCKWIIGLKDTKGAIERIQEYLKTVII